MPPRSHWILSSSNEHPVNIGPLCSKKIFNNTSIINHLGINVFLYIMYCILYNVHTIYITFLLSNGFWIRSISKAHTFCVM